MVQLPYGTVSSWDQLTTCPPGGSTISALKVWKSGPAVKSSWRYSLVSLFWTTIRMLATPRSSAAVPASVKVVLVAGSDRLGWVMSVSGGRSGEASTSNLINACEVDGSALPVT